MTVRDIAARLPLSYEDGRAYALVMSQGTADLLAAWQDTAQPQFRLEPQRLTDGSHALQGDVLSETAGLYAAVFANVNSLMDAEILPWHDVVAMFPQPEPPA